MDMEKPNVLSSATYNGPTINEWVIVNYNDSISKHKLTFFVKAIKEAGDDYGLTLTKPLEIINSKVSQSKKELPKLLSKYSNLQMIMCVLKESNGVLEDHIKEFGKESLNIVTKCVTEDMIVKKSKKTQQKLKEFVIEIDLSLRTNFNARLEKITHNNSSMKHGKEEPDKDELPLAVRKRRKAKPKSNKHDKEESDNDDLTLAFRKKRKTEPKVITKKKEQEENEAFSSSKEDEETKNIYENESKVTKDSHKWETEVTKDSHESESEVTNDSNENETEVSKDSHESESEVTKDSHESESEGEESDIPYVNAIRNILDVFENPGTFACGGVIEKAKLQLSVTGLGKIELPLSYKQGELLKTKSTAAPFGRGSETLLDKSIRDAWQIDAKDVTLNSKFNKLIQEKIEKIIPALMGESFKEIHKIKSELYKLVYYEINGHFVAHRDTEKAPGMFATLVIQLPAGHEGGALVVRHKDDSLTFDFEDESQNNFFYTAFFADCEHELTKVKAGHRLVLIYNLIRKDQESFTEFLHLNGDNVKPSNNEHFFSVMENSVKKWTSDRSMYGPNCLVLKLDHLYTEKNTSFKNLKGKDKIIADALCSCPDITLYLATLTKNEKRRCYEDFLNGPVPRGYKPELVSDDEFEPECSYTLQSFMGVNGKYKPFPKKDLGENEMLIKEKYMFSKSEAHSKREFEYTGNEGCKINYMYQKKALVFHPKSFSLTHRNTMYLCFNNPQI